MENSNNQSNTETVSNPPNCSNYQETNEKVATCEQNYKIPPIILRNKDKWNDLSKLIKNSGIQYTKAKSIADGVSVTPQTSEDYNKLFKLLENERDTFKFHTYPLQSERSLKVVFRGVM